SRPVALRLAVAAVLTGQPLLVPDTDADDGDETDGGPQDEDPCGDDEVDGGPGDPPYSLAPVFMISLPPGGLCPAPFGERRRRCANGVEDRISSLAVCEPPGEARAPSRTDSGRIAAPAEAAAAIILHRRRARARLVDSCW